MSDSSDVQLRRSVDSDQEAMRLDVFLTLQPEIASRSMAKALINGGAVTVDGRVRKAGSFLRPGQEVCFCPTSLEQIAVPEAAQNFSAKLEILFEDPHILVIDKQPGIVAHRPSSHRSSDTNIAELAQQHCGGEISMATGDDRPGIVHRLDKETSGVMILAKNDEASHYLRGQFKARTTRKEYRAIAYGSPRFDSDYIERQIAAHPRMGDRMTVVQEGGREASTYYEVLERFTDHSYLRCLPKTGRTHQIRVHLMSIGHSLVGDRFYRSRNIGHCRLAENAPDPGRHCLHALRLGIRHPHTHQEMKFEAPLPEDMEKLLRWLHNS